VLSDSVSLQEIYERQLRGDKTSSIPQPDSEPTQEFTPLRTDGQSGLGPGIDMGMGMYVCGVRNGQPAGEKTR
jgi:hypothetical protein